MDFGVTGKLGGDYPAEQYRKNAAADKTGGVSFAELAAAKAAGQSEASGMSFKDMWQTRFPGACYNVMDTSRIDGSLWGRNDYPWDKYFNNNADDSVLDWKPSGAEPAMSDPEVQAKINSTIGRKAIVVPPELEEKMKNDPELAKRVMAKVEGFIAEQDIMNPNPRKGYLIALDGNGDIAHACVTSEKMSVSSAEFIEARKAREEKHAEYERLAEESALKRRLMEQNSAGKSFAAQMNNVAGAKPHTSIVYMKTDDMLYSGGNGTGLSFYIKYAEGSTEDDPTVIAKGVDENGNEFEQTIHINKINPKCATVVEMRALEAHLGVDKNGGLSSLPPETGEMGLHDMADFMDMFQKQISDMRLLGQQKLVAYYQYSMQAYWDFMNRK